MCYTQEFFKKLLLSFIAKITLGKAFKDTPIYRLPIYNFFDDVALLERPHSYLQKNLSHITSY